MSDGHVYVARVAFGAKDAQTVRAFVEAEAHPGEEVAHRIELYQALSHLKLSAVPKQPA